MTRQLLWTQSDSLNSSAKTGVGTPVYMAPEVILGENKYDAKVLGWMNSTLLQYDQGRQDLFTNKPELLGVCRKLTSGRAE